MYIQPQGNVYLYYGYPGDKDYNDVVYFATKSAQNNYFESLTHFTLSGLSYTRKENNVIRCSTTVADRSFLESVNYIRFQNAGYSNDWFYGFVDRVEYVNNGRYDIYFTIDVMQTYFMGWLEGGLKQCLIERETAATDEIGDNIQDENIAVSEYLLNGGYTKMLPGTYEDTYDIILAIVDTAESSEGHRYDGIYGGATLYAYSAEYSEDSKDYPGITALTAKINEFVTANKADAIISIYMVPHYLVGSIPSDHKLASDRKGTATLIDKVNAITADDTLNGYKPKNKKLYTYPYNFLHVDDSNGGELTIKYEYFPDLKPRFNMYGTITTPVQLMIRPCNYKGVPDSDTGGYTTYNCESLVISSYPLCSWNTDTYAAWVAQNSNPAAVIQKVVEVGLSAASAGAMAGAVGAGVAGASGAAGALFGLGLSGYTAKNRSADTIHGTFANASVNVANGLQNIYYGRMSVNAERAEIIDDYFSMFGYACGKVKKPNISVRPHWTYTKTAGCLIVPDTTTGSAPAEAVKQIEGIFDHGVRFWNDGEEVGNYDLDNSPS